MKRKIITLFLAITIVLEITMLIWKNEDIETSVEVVKVDTSREKNEHSLKEVINELEKKGEIEVQNIHKEEESYFVKGVIRGSNDEFIDKLNSLHNLKIVDYSLDFNGEEIKGTFTLNYSTLGEI